MERKTSTLNNALIWFGAGVSIAEILTGTCLAPLGFGKGLLATLLGHVIGCILLFFAGLMGARTGKSSMETAAMSFGKRGVVLFAILNVVQLIGWTGIMIYDGALAANGAWNIGSWIWALVIGVLILVWILIGIENLGKINIVAMALLFGLTVILCVIIFRNGSKEAVDDGSISFGGAVELSVAMPLSWFPLISDYTREAKNPFRATMASAATYGVVSTWMFLIGMSATIMTGEGDIASIMLKAGLGVAGLLIIIFSTVTTTFMDAFSAGVSAGSISRFLKTKPVAVAVTVVGTAGAIIFPMDDITDFLYLIGSVFAPMIAVMLADFFLLKRDSSEMTADWVSFVIWLAGFALYRWLLHVDTPVGSTLPDMLATMILTFLVKNLIVRSKKVHKK